MLVQELANKIAYCSSPVQNDFRISYPDVFRINFPASFSLLVLSFSLQISKWLWTRRAIISKKYWSVCFFVVPIVI